MVEQIQLEQALFGYRDGHNLLAVSTVLAPKVRQFLATISDSSGSENSKDFEISFTGLPVPDTDFYALLCTWPAPEMPRPGCVWSHVILIQVADLARIPELIQLKSLCRRPSLPLQTDSYAHPILLDNLKVKHNKGGVIDQQRTLYLIRALYEHPQGGVVILDKESSVWEAPIFAIWSQQWPRLRREFSFSTGSLSDRRLGGAAFDLQIAPVGSERLWRRNDLPTLLLDYRASLPDQFDPIIPQWANLAQKDIRNESQKLLREFLFDYGSDIEKPRVAFPKLVTAFYQTNSDDESVWANSLILIAEYFPSQVEAVRLKQKLISLPKAFDSEIKLERAWTIISFLLDSRYAKAYPKIDFDFVSSAQSLWKEKREQTIGLLSRLVHQDENAAASSFAEGIASAIDPSSLQSIAEQYVELIPVVIRHKPSLAFEVDTWRLRGYAQTQVFEALTQLSLSEQDWGKIVGAMFIAASDVSVREAVAKAGSCAMLGAFRWLEHPVATQLLPSQQWRNALELPALQTLEHTEKLMPAQFALSAWCAPLGGLRRILSARREDIQQLAENSLNSLPAPLRIHTAFLMITIGLRENSDAGTNLILKSFFIVHEALATGSHSSESWWLLSPELPDLGWWHSWDRCEKLRRAVHDYLAKYKKNDHLLKAAKSADEQQLALKISEPENSSSSFVD